MMLVAYDVVVYKKDGVFQGKPTLKWSQTLYLLSTSSTRPVSEFTSERIGFTEQNSQLCGHPRVVSIKCIANQVAYKSRNNPSISIFNLFFLLSSCAVISGWFFSSRDDFKIIYTIIADAHVI